MSDMDRSDKELFRALREQFELLLHCEPARPVETGPSGGSEAIALAETLNRFIDRFNEAREFILALASGNLEVTPPPRNLLAAPFKQLHAGLKHLSWQTRRIADGDFSQRVHFMGDFSTAFNSMTDALRESKERLRLFIDHAPASLAMFDRQMRYMHASRRWMDEYGLGKRDLRGVSHYEVFPEISAEWKEAHRRGLAGEILTVEADRFQRADGSVQWIRWEIRPWHDAAGDIGGIVIFNEDISERMRVEEMLRHQEMMLREAGEIAHVGGWEFDPQTLKGSWTEETSRIHDLDPGQEIDAAQGLSFFEGESLASIEAAVREAMENGTPYDLELEIVSAKGVRKRVRTICHPVILDGRVVRVRGSIQDITGQRRMEENLRASEKKYRELVQKSNSAIIRWDCNGIITFFNEYAQSFFGYAEKEAVGSSVSIILPQKESSGTDMTGLTRDILAHPDRYINNVNENVCRNGRRVWMAWSNYPIYDSTGQVAEILAVGSDITGLRHAEETLRKSEEHYRSLFNNMLEGFACCRMIFEDGSPVDFVYIMVNEMFGTLTGLNNVVGKRVTEVIPGIREADPELFAIYARVSLTGSPERFEMFVETLQMWFSVSVYSPEKEFFVAVFDVITERKLAEAALKESQIRLQRAEEIAHLGYLRVDLETEQIIWSDEACRIFGVTPESFRAEPDRYEKLIHPDDRECMTGFREELRLKGIASFDFRIIRPDGEMRHVTGFGEITADGEGLPAAMFCTILDTTELRRKERELQEKNAEMERFTYLISHDLKSPLVTVKTFLGFLEKDLLKSDTEKIDRDIFHMRSATDKMGRMLDELLEMLRIGRLINPPEQVTFRELVEEALGMVAGRISECGVEVSISEDHVNLYGDRPRLAEIWQNLVENAVKFMGNQISPRIEIGMESHGTEKVFFVRDNGMGIDPRFKEKVFGLFEKLNPQTEGTGLGLALVKRIVELYRGDIRVESEGAGHGACFRFTLPGALENATGGGRS